ncbi:MAG: serpin family protein [Deltaproteobacteria bacterium]|nr:serpin family protein [Deltaproteobacteria bacterium]
MAEFPPDPDSIFCAMDFFRELQKTETGNFIFSPSSLRKALALACLGAKGGTREEIARVMRFSPDSPVFLDHWKKFTGRMNSIGKSKKLSIEGADALFIQEGYPFSGAYMEKAETVFGAEIKPVDFASGDALSEMDDWISKKTRGLIKNAIPPNLITAEARMFILDTLFFKGEWADPFETELTEKEPFFPSGGGRVMAKMMHAHSYYGYSENESFQILELPYSQGLNMIVVLPRKKDAKKSDWAKLDPEDLDHRLKRMDRVEVELAFPKFDCTSSLNLSKTCQALGIMDAFSDISADFSGITGQKGLYVSAIGQKAKITVDEKGTVAAAVTYDGPMVAAALEEPPKPIQFIADHPFAYLIMDSASGTVLFMGRVENPAE